MVSREALLDAVHGRSAGPFDRAIDNLVLRLRRKIEPDPAAPAIIANFHSPGTKNIATKQPVRIAMVQT